MQILSHCCKKRIYKDFPFFSGIKAQSRSARRRKVCHFRKKWLVELVVSTTCKLEIVVTTIATIARIHENPNRSVARSGITEPGMFLSTATCAQVTETVMAFFFSLKASSIVVPRLDDDNAFGCFVGYLFL